MNRFLLKRCAVTWLLAACGTVAAAPTSAPRLPAPSGEHPRVLFTAAELPAIRERLATPEGQRLVQALTNDASRFLRDFDKAFPLEEAARMAAAAPGGARDELVTRLRTGKLPYFDDIPYRAGLLAQLTDDPEHRRRAANYLRAWLPALTPSNGIAENQTWGHPRLALAYDLIHRDLSEAERQLARDLISANGLSPKMQQQLRNEWYVWGPNRANGSQSNWDCIYASNTLVSLMSIEGESCRFAVAPDAFANSVKVLHSFLLDGITADGAFFDGLNYPHGYGTHFMPHALLGLGLRAVDVVSDTKARYPGLWLTYEMLPWGGQGQAMNKADGNFSTDTMFPTWLAVHGGDTARWHFLNTSGAAYGVPPAVSPEIALLNGIPEATAWTPEKLPLSHWFSVIGKVICRGGWQAKDSHFVLSTNPISTGHSHADNGQFCYADQGVNFFTDSGAGHYASDDHNLVLIDGLGQARVEGSVEGFIRYAEFSGYADAADADLEESYTRFISGPLDGPWRFENYNPVQWADRRTLFIRGATGSILAIADDLCKDDQPHDYQWRAHSIRNNQLRADGRRFTITERYGGAVLQSVGKGQQCALVAQNVAAGKYRCWALVRGVPKFSRSWSNTQVTINGRNVRYDSTYFALGNFGDGWRWNEIRMNGPDSDPWLELPAGKLEVKLTGQTGSQVALFLFSQRQDWSPGFDLPQPTEPGILILGAADAIQGDKPWEQLDDPQAALEAVFLGRETPVLKVETSNLSGQPRVLANLRTTRWQSTCVAAAHETTAPRTSELLGSNGIRYRRGQAVDYVATGDNGRLAGEVLETDGAVAAAALPGNALAKYALLHGRNLRFDGTELVRADVPVTVLCDGTTLAIRAPSGARIACRRLTATTLRINGKETRLPRGDMPVITVPSLPDKWQVKHSRDGRGVTVTGDGPWPLKIHAPEARELTVNGVPRHFIRSERQKGEGWIWPYLESMACWSYAGEVGADTLKSWVTAGQAEKARLPQSTEEALRIERGATLRVPLAGPAEYELLLRVHTDIDTEILLRAGEVLKAWKVRGGGTSSTSMGGLRFTDSHGELLLLATAPFYLKGVLLKPKLVLLPPDKWAILGPFPAGEQTGEGIGKAMATAFVPEDGTLDAKATFTGQDTKPLAWVRGEVLPNPNDYRRSMWSRQLGFVNQGISYSATWIDSPSDRSADLGIMVDYWANAWLNGERIVSERSRPHVERDGCEFNDSLTRARMHLKKGRNLLLVKVRGGAGSNAFSGYISDPGDLKISCPLP
jgi:hypothetical protein